MNGLIVRMTWNLRQPQYSPTDMTLGPTVGGAIAAVVIVVVIVLKTGGKI